MISAEGWQGIVVVFAWGANVQQKVNKHDLYHLGRPEYPLPKTSRQTLFLAAGIKGYHMLCNPKHNFQSFSLAVFMDHRIVLL